MISSPLLDNSSTTGNSPSIYTQVCDTFLFHGFIYFSVIQLCSGKCEHCLTLNIITLLKLRESPDYYFCCGCCFSTSSSSSISLYPNQLWFNVYSL